MNLVLSTTNGNAVIVQETVDGKQALSIGFDPASCTVNIQLADLKKETVAFSFRLDTNSAMNEVATFLKSCELRRRDTLAEAKAAGKPISKELESALVTEEMLTLIEQAQKNMKGFQLFLSFVASRYLCTRKQKNKRNEYLQRNYP